MISRLLRQIDLFYKLAAAPEFVQMKDEVGSELWFGDQISKANGDKYFAILDRSNIDAIKKLEREGLLYFDDDSAEVWYLKNDKTQSLMSFIIDRYNKYFPHLDGNETYDFLYNDGTLDADSGASSPNPVFILIHDLIHQVIYPQFSKSLVEQQEAESEQGLGPSLLDELNEDIASSLSNFQPTVKNIGQGIWKYLRSTFYKKWEAKGNADPASSKEFEDKLKMVIEETFHYAKAELRGKVDKLVERHTINSPKIPNEVKQLVDGILSKAKYQMLQQVEDIADEGFERKINYPSKLFDMFDISRVSEQYYDKIMESKIIKQPDSSALRSWMFECLGAMKSLNNYFSFEIVDELRSEQDELEE